VKRVLLRICQGRVVQFLTLGAILYALAPKSDVPGRVSISKSYLDSLYSAQAERLGIVRLDPQAESEVERRAIEDEVLYREALRYGLDRDDGIVRQHLIQRMLIVAEDLSGASREPTLEQMRAYFEANRARYRVADAMRAIFVFGVDRAALAGLRGDAQSAEASRPGVPPPLGDAFPRSRDVRGSKADFAATYGEEFADALAALPVGVWSDPLRSRFGYHLVKVLGHEAGRLSSFDEVAERVRLDLTADRRRDATAHFVKRAFAHYEVDVAGVRVRNVEPTKRLALRSQPSRED
jgi:hypothetical protein